MRKTDLLGPWGEALAAEYLRRKHYEVLACNFRTRVGEIDLIVCNRRYLVFVEVKLRKSDAFGQAREFVDAKKQSCVRQAAMLWLEQNETGLQPRFDVIEIYAPEGIKTRKPVIHHLEDAFS